MKIPLKYNFGSLWVRRVGTLMTALGIGLTVSVFIIMMALVNGLDSTFVDTGHENHLVVIRDGSLNEVNSYFNRDLFQTIRLLPGISVGDNNEPPAVEKLWSSSIIQELRVNRPMLSSEGLPRSD